MAKPAAFVVDLSAVGIGAVGPRKAGGAIRQPHDDPARASDDLNLQPLTTEFELLAACRNQACTGEQ